MKQQKQQTESWNDNLCVNNHETRLKTCNIIIFIIIITIIGPNWMSFNLEMVDDDSTQQLQSWRHKCAVFKNMLMLVCI